LTRGRVISNLKHKAGKIKNMLDWQAALQRQALAEWRDRQVLAAFRMLNTLSADARRKFDESLAEANLKDTVWDPASFADHRIDALLCATAPPALDQFLRAAGAELSIISEGFAAYGEALARSHGFSLPNSPANDQPTQSEGFPSEQKYETEVPKPDGGQTTGSRWSFSGLALVRTVSALSGRATNAVRDVGVAAEREIQTRTGLYDRLRTAAAARVATRWMGSGGEPRSVLSQLIDLIDGVTGEARANLL